ncbi:FecR family protein [Methylocaldum gracile subsp. desertum]|uniref:FecR family protein n=1 Tax=Methylocaldum sp. GT1BW TaxID=3438964 RepID=UPI003DA015CE
MNPSDRRKLLSDQAIDWLVLLRSGAAGDGDRQRFAEWLAEGPEYADAFQEAERLWASVADVLSDEAGDLRAEQPAAVGLPEKRPSPISPAGRRRLRPARWAAAAALLLALGLQGLYLGDFWLSDYATGTGEQKLVRLDDGSTVLLDTDTAIALDWNPSRRRIRIRHGQAVFTVAPDAARPFEVETGPAVIRALGTVFEVSESTAGDIAVTVQEHAVSVRLADGRADSAQAAVRVASGQRVTYSPTHGLSSPEKTDLSQATAWQRHKLIFKDQPLVKVVAELDRYRPGKILIADHRLEDLRVTGVFSLDDSDAILAAVEKALAIRSTRLSPWLVLLHR